MTDKLTPVRCGCGGEAVANDYIDRYENKTEYFVHCVKCGICSADYDTEAEAITAWNRAMSGATDTNVGDKERTAKVICVEKPIIGDAEGNTIRVSSCGNCKNVVSIFDNFCPNCGCRLIWGNDNE